MFYHSKPLTWSIFQNWLKDKVTFALALEVSSLTKLQWNLLFSMKNPLFRKKFQSDIFLQQKPFPGPNGTFLFWEKGNNREASFSKKD